MQLELKKCTKCHIDRTFNNFSIRDNGKLNNQCKICVSKYLKEYLKEYNKDEKNKETIASYHKNWELENKEKRSKQRKAGRKNNPKILERERIWENKNKEKRKLWKKKYKIDNKDKISKQSKEHYRINKKEILKKRKSSNKNRRKSDLLYRLRNNLSRQINKMLKSNGANKNRASILNHLTYDIEELKKHIEFLFEPWMTWENQGRYTIDNWKDNDPTTWTWQVDHIIPHSTFKYESMDCEEFRQCWALSNLRPYSAKQNLIDGVNRSRHLVLGD
jgi:hypothetical protein